MTAIQPLTRRLLLRTLIAGGAVSALRKTASNAEPSATVQPAKAHEQHAALPLTAGSEIIYILLFPGFTALDAIGPHHMLASMSGASVKFAAKTIAPVKCESGFEITPHISFAHCAAEPDLLIVPGGTDGVLHALSDHTTLEFIRKVGGASKLAGSVCTGSLLLGAAGLLKGYEATSHWQTIDLLPLLGARPSSKRVVFDRNRVTGAGVTAGLDFALELVRHFRGDFYAKGVQLLAQYDPAPPYDHGGDPKQADKDVVAFLNEMHKPLVEMTGKAVRAAFDGSAASDSSKRGR